MPVFISGSIDGGGAFFRLPKPQSAQAARGGAAVARFALDLGEGCARMHDRLVRDLSPSEIQADEIWSFVHTKEARVRPGDPEDSGDCYTWVALDPHSKFVIACLVGKRDGTHASRFMLDLRKRILTRAQITSDGLVAYVDAVESAFGRHGVQYGQVSWPSRSPSRRRPPRCRRCPRGPWTTPCNSTCSASPHLPRRAPRCA